MKRLSVTMVLTLLVALVASSQAKIERLVNDLEKQKGVEVTYSERRDPKTKKIIRQNNFFKGNSSAMAQKLWDAFEAERNNSVSVTKAKNTNYMITFESDGYKTSYMLTVNNAKWTLLVTKDRISKRSSDDSYLVGLLDVSGELTELAELDFGDAKLNTRVLEALKNVGQLKSLKSVTVIE